MDMDTLLLTIISILGFILLITIVASVYVIFTVKKVKTQLEKYAKGVEILEKIIEKKFGK